MAEGLRRQHVVERLAGRALAVGDRRRRHRHRRLDRGMFCRLVEQVEEELKGRLHSASAEPPQGHPRTSLGDFLGTPQGG